ncbi:ArnT family glycosyltransferase [Companilactobacillus muriivasis]|uniref:ArnT family glycosyltransferase n=1 Tax=Companilactobacillus muriivasis TaxID=3081444 RepID=UPI0030C6CF4E
MKLQKMPMIIMVSLLIIFGILLCYRLDNIPGLFIDEINYMNEVISKANFGTDIQGLRHPVYFASVWGQGQSVLYSWIVGPWIKLLGFSILVFRLPMVLLSILMVGATMISIFLVTKDKLLAICVEIALISMPWLIISSRWVLDANVSPIFIMMGLLSFYVSVSGYLSKRMTMIFLVLSGIIMSLSAYGYIASWLYLPVLVIALAIFSLRKRLLGLKEIILWLFTMVIVAIPLIIFAYRVNIQHIDHFTKFIFFDIPYLKANRTSSLINFNQHILGNIIINLKTGMFQFNSGTDGLPQNGLHPYGAIMPWMLVFFVIGVIVSKNKLKPSAVIFRNLIEISIVSFIPAMMIIQANFNHWNFLWIPMTVIVGYGLYFTVNVLTSKILQIATLVFPILLILIFSFSSYFGVSGKNTYFNNFSGSAPEASSINRMMKSRYSRNNLYIEGMSGNFSIFRLIQHPINAVQYQSLEGSLRRSNVEIIPSPEKSFGYLRDASNIGQARKGDLAMIYQENVRSFRFDKRFWRLIENTKFSHHSVEIFQKISNKV